MTHFHSNYSFLQISHVEWCCSVDGSLRKTSLASCSFSVDVEFLYPSSSVDYTNIGRNHEECHLCALTAYIMRVEGAWISCYNFWLFWHYLLLKLQVRNDRDDTQHHTRKNVDCTNDILRFVFVALLRSRHHHIPKRKQNVAWEIRRPFKGLATANSVVFVKRRSHTLTTCIELPNIKKLLRYYHWNCAEVRGQNNFYISHLSIVNKFLEIAFAVRR